MTRPTGRVLALVVLVAVAGASSGWATGPLLHELPATAPDGFPPTDEPWAVIFTVRDVPRVLDSWPTTLDAQPMPDRPVAPSATTPGGRVWAWIDTTPVFAAPPRSADREPSFLVDFDEPDVVALSRVLLDQTPSPTLDAVIRFTDQSIHDKTMARSWDVASRVAREGQGDCTEHAVLAAALARSGGLSARLIGGIALVLRTPPEGQTGEPQLAAFGHAWAEIHDGEQWRLADASMPERQPGVEVRYVPVARIENEGPGYRLDVARIRALLPETVELRRRPPTARP